MTSFGEPKYKQEKTSLQNFNYDIIKFDNKSNAFVTSVAEQY